MMSESNAPSFPYLLIPSDLLYFTVVQASMWDSFHLIQLSNGNRKWLQSRGSMIKSTPGLWRAGSSGGARGLTKGASRELDQVCPLQGSQGSVSGERRGRVGRGGVG